MGEGEPLIILHGLFGSSDNWQTLGKKFAEDFKVYLVDQRNHGHSPHSDDFSYELMAADLHRLIQESGESEVNLIGHSMGGKTVMELAAHHPELIKKMIVADIGVKSYPMHHDVILEAFHSLDLGVINSRGEADRQMSALIPDFGVRQFLLKNLYWVEKGQLGWRMNLRVLEEKMPGILSEIDIKDCPISTLFIRGDQSNYILDADLPEISERFDHVSFHTIKGVGHWVHAEAPAEFYQTVMNFLRS